MNKYVLALGLLLAVGAGHAQVIDVKKNIILIDGKECMKVDRKNPNNISVSDMKGDDIFYLKFADDKFGRRYNTIVFVRSKRVMYSQQYIYANAKMVLKRLLDSHAIQDCQINDDKLDNFIAKYGENVPLD